MPWINDGEFKITCEDIDDDFNNLPSNLQVNLVFGGVGWSINKSAPGGSHSGTGCLTSRPTVDGGVTKMKFNFNFGIDGYISFYYKVSSEDRYDFIRIYVDGTERVNKSGTSGGWTLFKLDLLEGDHILEVHYTKDGSNGNGSDMAFVDEMVFSGLLLPYAKKYLVLSEGEYLKYNLDSGVWISVGTEVSPEIYIEHGMDEQPQLFILKRLNSPTICYWIDIEPTVVENKLKKITVEAIPKPILFIQNGEFTLSKIYQTGIKNCLIEKELSQNSILKFAFSIDSGQTWKNFNINNRTWNEIDLTLARMMEDGTPYGIVETLSENEWSALLGESTKFKMAFIGGISSLTDVFRIRQITFNYTTTV